MPPTAIKSLSAARDTAFAVQKCWKRTLSPRSDAADFIERILDHLLLAPRAVRTDGETVRFVAQALDEIKNRIARRQRKVAARIGKEALASSIAVDTLGNADRGYAITDAEFIENGTHRRHLSLTAVNQNDVRPGR